MRPQQTPPRMSTNHTTVLVVGAGPTGLTAALTLLKNGVKVRIIDASAETHDAARGTALMPRTQELLEILGAIDEVKAVATGPLQMAVYGEDGTTILKAFEWSQGVPPSPTTPYANIASISQSEIERILRLHLGKYGCQVEMGTKLVGLTQDSTVVSAKVLVGDATEATTITADYLIAADGARGISRRLLGVSFLGETKEDARLWTANVQVPGFSRQYWHRWGDFATMATSLKPITTSAGGGDWFQMLTLGPELPKDIPRDLAETQTLFKAISKRSDLVFADVRWVSEWKANIRMADRFSVGRVFLAGDAAHCHSPAGGQGTNTAMMDAFNLAWKLALVAKGKAAPTLLDSYEAERMPVVAEMLSLSNELHAKAFTHIPSTAFTTAAGTVTDDPMVRSAKMLQLGVNYRWSTIVRDKRDLEQEAPAAERNRDAYVAKGNVVCAGDRAPVFSGLLKLVRNSPSHVVLVFPGPLGSTAGLDELKPLVDADLVRIVVVAETSSAEVRDAQVVAAARTAYAIDADRDVFVAVRPDGVLGAYTFSVAGVQKYFKGLGVVM
ncbi:FAD-binding-3 domain-containing protein [Mycena chlorophos]|uniref:FAD-binding-3 domain-containing protein n=1 Tax=Mycena chlorophos TaxID=658473 RepID=A0A8H6W5L8_MYCCL|nr:FAD-binding-3 domain-containing protein [Mycena chlorophos]